RHPLFPFLLFALFCPLFRILEQGGREGNKKRKDRKARKRRRKESKVWRNCLFFQLPATLKQFIVGLKKGKQKSRHASEPQQTPHSAHSQHESLHSTHIRLP